RRGSTSWSSASSPRCSAGPTCRSCRTSISATPTRSGCCRWASSPRSTPTPARSGCWSRRSDDRDAAAERFTPGGQGAQNLPRASRQHPAQTGSEGRERRAVRSGVRHEENQVTIGVVAELQGELALERLAVGDARLRLDPCPPRPRVSTADLGVPGPEVLLDREGNFRSPTQGRMEADAKSLEQRELGAVPDRIAGRVGPDREVETEHRKPCADVLEHHPSERPVLESEQLLVGAAARTCASPEAEAARNATHSMLLAGTNHRRAKTTSTTVARPFTGSHERIMSGAAALAVTRGFGPRGGATDKRDARRSSRGPAGGPVGGGRARFRGLAGPRSRVGPAGGPGVQT